MEFCGPSALALIFYGLQLSSLQNALLGQKFRRIKSAKAANLPFPLPCSLHSPIRGYASAPTSVNTVKLGVKRSLGSG